MFFDRVRVIPVLMLTWCILCAVCSGSCRISRYVFGAPLPDSEKTVFIHKVGFSYAPEKNRPCENGTDCICENLTCFRRQSEYCLVPKSQDDDLTQTTKSYAEANPYETSVGVVLIVDQTHVDLRARLELLVGTCYPFLAVFCAIRGEPETQPWMRSCCDALVFSDQPVRVNESLILHRESSNRSDELTIFSLAPIESVCNKCGLAMKLSDTDLQSSLSYRQRQSDPHHKTFSIVVRNRDPYLTFKNANETLRVHVTGGFEDVMVQHVSAALNFSYYYIGNLTTITTGGSVNNNGTFNGMLDFLLKRTALISLSNQKPIPEGAPLFSESFCYDINLVPFASRIDNLPVTINTLFQSLGNHFMLTTLAFIVFFSLVTFAMLGAGSVKKFFTIIWFFISRLFHPWCTLAMICSSRVPSQIKALLMLWAIMALIFTSMFNGVWVTFMTTSPFKGAIDRVSEVISYIRKHNSSCFMSKGMQESETTFGPDAKPIFDHAVVTKGSASLVVAELRRGKYKSFWLYEEIFLIFELNRFDKNGSIHVSAESVLTMPQCWLFQKNCALEKTISRFLSYYTETGLHYQLKKNFNILNLPPRKTAKTFKPLKLSQLSGLMIFMAIVPVFIIIVAIAEYVVGRRAERKLQEEAYKGEVLWPYTYTEKKPRSIAAIVLMQFMAKRSVDRVNASLYESKPARKRIFIVSATGHKLEFR